MTICLLRFTRSEAGIEVVVKGADAGRGWIRAMTLDVDHNLRSLLVGCSGSGILKQSLQRRTVAG
jgi:hypothetical protein